jgi:predicted DNA-binding helix-hairpin-helix protein
MQSKYFVVASLAIVTMLSMSCGKTSTQTLNEMITTGGKLELNGNFRGYGSQKVSGPGKNLYG